MGSTVTCDRMVSTFISDLGSRFYVLWEETYEKNCYPHTPHWCCVGIGTAAEMIERVFYMGSICEGGMLQRRGGNLTPEGYIGSWLSAMAQPFAQREAEISLTVSEAKYTMEVPAARKDDLVTVLRANGSSSLANALEDANKTRGLLSTHAEGLIAAYRDGILSAWQILPDYRRPRTGEERVATECGIKLDSRRKGDLPAPQVVRVDGAWNVLERDAQDVWRSTGPVHGRVAGYVTSLGRGGAAPANYKAMIGAYRTAMDTSPILVEAVVHLDPAERSADDIKYASDHWNDLVTGAGAVATGAGFKVSYRADNAYDLCRFRCAAWSVTEVRLEETAPAPAKVPKLVPGDVIEFAEPVKFNGGAQCSRFTVTTMNRKGRNMTVFMNEAGMLFKLPGRILVNAMKVAVI